MNIVTIQTQLFWEDRNANLAMFDSYFETLKGKKIDLMVLPEMFTTGFSMNPEKLAENTDKSTTLTWMKEKAAAFDSAVCGSIIVEENGDFYNRLYWVEPDGNYYFYDKRHLFAFAGEHLHFKAGEKKLIVDWRGWKICPLICYDLRFPVWSRNYEDYDILIYVANWPSRRANAWKSLLAARAIENQAYCIGVNRVGEDGNKLLYSGETSVIDFEGNVIYQKSVENDIFLHTFSKGDLANFRTNFPFLNDKDKILTKF